MSLGLNKTKRRIASVTSTKKITKAMELIATVKLKKFKNTMIGNSHYSEEILRIVDLIFSNSESIQNELAEEVNSNKDLYVVITSDLGLCAGYNSNIYKYVNEVVKDNDELLIVGQKGESHFKSENRPFKSLSNYFEAGITDKAISQLSNYLSSLYLSKEYRNIYIIYTHYVNSIAFTPNSFKLFPIIHEKSEVIGEPILIEPNAKEVVDALIPIYINSLIYQKFLEAQVSEQASRRNAMDNANDNADELLDKLTLEYNKARQASITNQITEIVGAANAQK